MVARGFAVPLSPLELTMTNAAVPRHGAPPPPPQYRGGSIPPRASTAQGDRTGRPVPTRHRTQARIAFVLALALSGCAGGPDYLRPPRPKSKPVAFLPATPVTVATARDEYGGPRGAPPLARHA